MGKLYHINPETGRPGECTASVRGCKYIVDGQTVEHYNSLDEALDAYENINKNNTLTSLKKSEKLDEFSVQHDIIHPKFNVERSKRTNEAYLVEVEEPLNIDDDMGDQDEEIQTPKLSAPKTPSEYKPADAVEVIEPDKALALVDELPEAKSVALEKKSATWADTITSLNPNSQEFEKHTKAINKIGNKAFHSTAELSQNFLMNNSSTKVSASDTIGNQLVKLRNTMEDMAPDDNTFKTKALSFLPGRNAVKKYFNRFESNGKQMNAIIKSLNEGQARLHQENAELALERQQLWNDLGTLQEADGLLRSMDNQVVQKINEAKANGNNQMAKALEQNVLFNVRQRRQDVVTQTAVTVQSYMAMGMIEQNNEKLQQNIERTKTTTVAALSTAARIHEALGGQKKILDGIDEMKNLTNNIMLDNARQLQQNTLKIQEQATSTSVDTAVLKESFDRMFETMDQMDQFRTQANRNFLTTINALGEQVNRANKYAQERNNRNQLENSGQTKLQIEDVIEW